MIFTRFKEFARPYAWRYAAGLGLLTKGPLGLLLPLVPAVATGLFFRRRARWRDEHRPLRWPWHLAGALLAALIAVPWAVAVCRITPAAVPYFLGKAVGPMASAKGMHGGPPIFYIYVLLGGLFPWSRSRSRPPETVGASLTGVRKHSLWGNGESTAPAPRRPARAVRGQGGPQIMRYLNGFFCVIMILFVAVQYNDPDYAIWMVIYGISAICAGVAALRPRVTPAAPRSKS